MYTATPVEKNLIKGTSNYRIVVEFVSNTPATEPTFRKELIITPSMTVQQGREWIYEQINNAKPRKSVADLIVIGTPVVPLAPAAPPAPTAFQVWRAKLDRLRLLRSGLTPTGAAATAINALEADVWATYQAGYLDQL